MQLRQIALATALLTTFAAPAAVGGPLGGIVGGHGILGSAGMLGGDFGGAGPSLHSRARGTLDGAAHAGSGVRPRALDIESEAEGAGSAAGRLRAPSGIDADAGEGLGGGALGGHGLRGASPRHVQAAAEGAAEGGLGVMARRAPVPPPAMPDTTDASPAPVTASRGVSRALAGGLAADGAARGGAAGGGDALPPRPSRGGPAAELDAGGDAQADGHADAGGVRTRAAASGSADARVSHE